MANSILVLHTEQRAIKGDTILQIVTVPLLTMNKNYIDEVQLSFLKKKGNQWKNVLDFTHTPVELFKGKHTQKVKEGVIGY